MNPIFFMILMFVVMWFLLIRPQQREQQARRNMMAALKKGDRVVTIGGIFGVVQAVHEHDLVVKIDEKSNTRIKLLKTAVHQRLTEDDETAAKKDDAKKDDAKQVDAKKSGDAARTEDRMAEEKVEA